MLVAWHLHNGEPDLIPLSIDELDKFLKWNGPPILVIFQGVL
jgi:hypothetical protein